LLEETEPGQQAQSQTLRIMTYNIHRWAGSDHRMDLERTLAIIRSSDADVVALNEVIHPVTQGAHTHDYLGELAGRLGMSFHFGPSGWVDYGPEWHGPQGNALLSRYPLENAKSIPLPRLPTTKQRGLLGARLAAGPARGLTAFVTHLDHAFEVTRLMQVQGVLAELAQHGAHFIAGDFNTPGFRGRYTRHLSPPVLRLMRTAGYEDAFHAVGEGSGRTYPARSPLFRVDFVFFPKAWASGVCRAHAFGSDPVHHASDHRPTVVEWAWPDGADHPRSDD
jgi:endonuclease/exonuclease/phosphatase family metal-dependent hydrolase